MKIGIIGVGGVGGYFGGLLAKAGLDVTFVARGEHGDTIRRHGLTVKAVTGDFIVHPKSVIDTASKLGPQDLIMICTKSYDLKSAVESLRSALRPSTIVIPFLNGIDHDLNLKEDLPNAEVYPGFVYIISAKTAPGLIEQTAGPRTLFFGDRAGKPNDRLKELEQVFRNADILATATDDVVREMWRKYVWLCAFAGLTSMRRSTIGPICDDPSGKAALIQAIYEGVAVARAHGVNLDDAMRDEMVGKLIKYQTTDRNAKSSMLVDLENGRRTEIETLNGRIVELGRSYGLRVPTHEAICASVRGA